MLAEILPADAGAPNAALPPVPVPPENPITEPKRVLGKILFWDEQLSTDDSVACGTCHQPHTGGADPRLAIHPGPDASFGTQDDVFGSAGVVRRNASGTPVSDPLFGFAPQVAPQAGVSPLFLVRGRERRRIEWRGGDRFALRGGEGEPEPIARLLETIEGNPAAVSPGVLARPAIQDAVLGSALFLVGPGEMAYLAQAAAAHEVLGVAPPAVALRPHALVLDRRSREHLAELGSTLAELSPTPTAM